MFTSPASFHILLALFDEDRHGLGILDEVERHTGVALPVGTLYRSLKTLWDDGLIAPAPRRPSSGDDPRRRYYRVTPAGRAAAREEARRAERLLAWARTQKVLGPGLA